MGAHGKKSDINRKQGKFLQIDQTEQARVGFNCGAERLLNQPVVSLDLFKHTMKLMEYNTFNL